MRRTSRISALSVTLVTLLFAQSLGAIIGVRDARAATPMMRSHAHAMATHLHTARPGREADHHLAVVSARSIGAMFGPCGTEGCMGQAGGNCRLPGMPAGAPCCSAHCAAAPAMAASTPAGVRQIPASTPLWGRARDLESAPSTPDRPPPRD